MCVCGSVKTEDILVSLFICVFGERGVSMAVKDDSESSNWVEEKKKRIKLKERGVTIFQRHTKVLS